MSMLTKRHLRNEITYWSPNAKDAKGRRTFNAPITIYARWEERPEVIDDVESFPGRTISTQTVIFTKQELQVEGYVHLGDTEVSDPKSVEGAMQIMAKAKVENLSGKKTLHKYWLTSKYRYE